MQYHCAICAFQQFGSVFSKKRKDEGKLLDKESNDQEKTLSLETFEPEVSLIIDVSDDEKAGSKRKRVVDSEGTEDDTDQLFLPIKGDIESDNEIPVKGLHR